MDCASSINLYAAAEGAFGTVAGGGEYSDEVGTCPAPDTGRDCTGTVSNCWSPGQRDTGNIGMNSFSDWTRGITQ